MADTLVVVTVNAIPTSGDGDVQNVDVEIVDGSKHNNIYLSKRGVTGETRMAINTHAHADLGVCFKNTLGKSEWSERKQGGGRLQRRRVERHLCLCKS